MVGRLQQEIQQRRPFTSLEEEAFLNLLRTANALNQGLATVLKSADLTTAQYNVLRILRGAGPGGLPSGEVGERMVTRDPDVTRLLDRLERRGLVERCRDAGDRRVVRARITEAGLGALAPLDDCVADIHLRQLSHLGEARLRELVALLEAARDGVEGIG
jgi:DNA-binding MarR family transcriptional regulator